tara:strand:+ start:333 stop:542 length:210 start_codon:yes stop_codon:yes gene_type:complete
MQLERKAEIFLERFMLKRRVKKLENELSKLKKKDIAKEERRKNFNITTISKKKIDGHWYFKGSDILSCQ